MDPVRQNGNQIPNARKPNCDDRDHTAVDVEHAVELPARSEEQASNLPARSAATKDAPDLGCSRSRSLAWTLFVDCIHAEAGGAARPNDSRAAKAAVRDQSGAAAQKRVGRAEADPLVRLRPGS